jgi:CheY-like chemotaxis protein
MGVDVTSATGPSFTNSELVVNIVSKRWRLGTTGVCHSGLAIVSTVIQRRVAAILRNRNADRMEDAAVYAADIHVLHVSRKLLNSKGSIVIVESDDLIRELLERWLGDAGYGVTLPAKGYHPGTVTPQLVIADISSPDSAETTIKALAAAYSAPILALSARFRQGLGGSEAAAHRLQVCKVLPKPFTREELLDAVGESIERL